MLVSIIIPVIRPKKAERCVKAIKENAGIPAADYEIITEIDFERIGCPKMINKLGRKSKGDMVCFLGDDTIPQKDFLKNAIRAMQHIPDGYGMVSFNDNPTTTAGAAHWLLDKRMLPLLGGDFVHEGYSHSFCDDELLARCGQAKRYIYAFDALIKHDHPIFKGGGAAGENIRKSDDPEYAKAYVNYEADKDLFQQRIQSQWGRLEVRKQMSKKVVIGVPSGDMIHTDFALSLLNLALLSLTHSVKSAVVNYKSALVEVGRNEIVAQAEDLGADYVLFLDTDMTFPPDTLLRLLDHDLDIVGCDASRKREPFTSVVKDVQHTQINYAKCKPLEELSGGSSACQLIKMDVFRKMKAPYYRVHWAGGRKFIGEDYIFSIAARDAGFKVWCDTKLSLQIGHLGVKEYKINA